MDLYDELVPISGPEAIETAQKLARMEGIFTGISGGASMAGALKVAEKAPKGSVILTMLPDTSERYMSTPLYESIAADMNEEELEIAKSTPSFQLLPGEEPRPPGVSKKKEQTPKNRAGKTFVKKKKMEATRPRTVSWRWSELWRI